MTKIAFMFPGQGSYEAGMGREIAEAVPEAMAVYDAGSEASGLDLRALLPRARRGAARHEDPAAGARRDEPGDQRGDSRARHRAGLRRRPLGRRVRGARRRPSALTPAEAIALVRERGLAMAEAAEAAPGLDGGDPRPRRRGRRGALPQDRRTSGRRTTTAPARSSSRARTLAVDECCVQAEEEGARRAVRLRVSGAFHSPLVARAADRLRPAIDKVPFREPRAAVHVDGDGEDRGRRSAIASCSSSS